MSHEKRKTLPTLIVKHMCLANAFRDEQDPQLRLGMRLKPICDYLKQDLSLPMETRPVIYSIKELRVCFDRDHTKKMTPSCILGQIFGSFFFVPSCLI